MKFLRARTTCTCRSPLCALNQERVLSWECSHTGARVAALPADVPEIDKLQKEVDRLLAENDQLRRQVEGHCARIAAQSELLAKRAEKCPACAGTGGLLYEPGCIVAACDRCGGSGKGE